MQVLTARIPDDLMDWFKDRADAMSVPISVAVRMMMTEARNLDDNPDPTLCPLCGGTGENGMRGVMGRICLRCGGTGKR